MNNLLQQTIELFDEAVQSIIEVFELKQGVSFDFWVSDEVAGVATFGDNYFNFSDILLDLREGADVGEIFEWQNTLVETDTNINYNSWLLGARPDLFKLKFKDLQEKGIISDVESRAGFSITNGEYKEEKDGTVIYSFGNKNLLEFMAVVFTQKKGYILAVADKPIFKNLVGGKTIDNHYLLSEKTTDTHYYKC